MKIVVIGGYGRVGSRLVSLLSGWGHEVVAASRRSGVDVVTGQGVSEALTGAAAVVDVSNTSSFEGAAAMAFFTAGTRALLAAEATAGVRHHVALSLFAGDDLLDNGYVRAKRGQEELIAASLIPYSIVRATQFFEFLDAIADAQTQGGVIRVPPVHIQPIAAADVAAALARIVTGPPIRGTIELGGPEPNYLDALMRRILGARHDPRAVIVDAHARYFGGFAPRSLVATDEAELGEIRFDDWLAGAARVAPAASVREHEFRVGDLTPGAVLILGDVAVFSVEGGLCATQARCTHRQAPLSEGTVDGSTVTCALHGACFNVWTGAVLRGPAAEPLITYPVRVEGGVGRVRVPVANAVYRGAAG